MGFSHADRVFVIGDVDCQPSTIQPRKKGKLSVMLQHADVQVPTSIFRTLIDETHAQRPGFGPVCRAAATTAASAPSAVRVVVLFSRLLDDFFFL